MALDDKVIIQSSKPRHYYRNNEILASLTGRREVLCLSFIIIEDIDKLSYSTFYDREKNEEKYLKDILVGQLPALF